MNFSNNITSCRLSLQTTNYKHDCKRISYRENSTTFTINLFLINCPRFLKTVIRVNNSLLRLWLLWASRTPMMRNMSKTPAILQTNNEIKVQLRNLILSESNKSRSLRIPKQRPQSIQQKQESSRKHELNQKIGQAIR